MSAARKDDLAASLANIEVRWTLGSALEFPVGTGAAYNVYALVMSECLEVIHSISVWKLYMVGWI